MESDNTKDAEMGAQRAQKRERRVNSLELTTDP